MCGSTLNIALKGIWPVGSRPCKVQHRRSGVWGSSFLSYYTVVNYLEKGFAYSEQSISREEESCGRSVIKNVSGVWMMRRGIIYYDRTWDR
jgi:hypothetical protein